MMQTDRYGLALVVLAGAIVFAHLVWHPKCLILTRPTSVGSSNPVDTIQSLGHGVPQILEQN
jgi:hypothetical protein